MILLLLLLAPAPLPKDREYETIHVLIPSDISKEEISRIVRPHELIVYKPIKKFDEEWYVKIVIKRKKKATSVIEKLTEKGILLELEEVKILPREDK